MLTAQNQEGLVDATGLFPSESSFSAMPMSPKMVQHDYFNDMLTEDTSLCTQCWAACCYGSYSPDSIKRGTCIQAERYSNKVLYS
jgi:hypothetical protein